MLNVLFKSSTSVCLELHRPTPYSGKEFDVLLNGEKAASFSTNVFSLYSLEPNTAYTIEADGERVELITDEESVCLNVLDFFAKADGKTNDTNAVQGAINVCPPNGRVYIPSGTYLVNPLTLKSNITLELAEGATLLCTPVKEQYPILPGEASGLQFTMWEGDPRAGYMSLINLHYTENTKIVGRGMLDGNAYNTDFYIDVKKMELSRPRIMFANHAKNLTLHGVKCQNSASWNYHPYFCENVSFLDTDIFAGKDAPNTDGIDPEACNGVNIIGVRFSVGDDCIALKSGKIYIGTRYKTPCTNIVIRNCYMKDGHGGVVLGSEMGGGIQNLSVSKCVFEGTDRGLRIKTRRGRGKYAVVDNVYFSDIIMKNVLSPLVVNMFYYCDPDGKTEYVWSKEKLAVDDRTPRLGRFGFRNIKCTGVEHACGFFYGLPEQPIEEIALINVSFETAAGEVEGGNPAMMSFAKTCKKEGLYLNNVGKLTMVGVSFNGVEGDTLQLSNVGSVVTLDCQNTIMRYVDRVLRDSTPDKPLWNVEQLRHGKEPSFNYIDGCMLTALLALYEQSGEEKYLSFAKNHLDYYISDKGEIRGFKEEDYNIDNVCGGRVLFDMVRYSDDKRYQLAIERLNNQLINQPRTGEGSFWHKLIYPNQVWLDGLFMGQVFASRYAAQSKGAKKKALVADILKQFNTVRQRMFSESKELYFHGYDASKRAFWADENGLSKNHWLRAEGWYLAALADCIGYLGRENAEELVAILHEAAGGIVHYIEASSGMLYQVVDKAGREGNYPETSGSALVAYALLKGARLGALEPHFADIGAGLFYSICARYLSEDKGELNLGGICLVAGLGPESNKKRDGSFEYYISEPIVENDAKGTAPLLLAFTELYR